MPDTDWLPDWFWDDPEAAWTEAARKYVRNRLAEHIEFWPHTHPQGSSPLENSVYTPADRIGVSGTLPPVHSPSLSDLIPSLVPAKILRYGTVTHVEIHPETFAQILAQSNTPPLG